MPVRWSKGKYQVTRFCCTSGMCITCRAAGDRTKRKRIIHTTYVSKAWALQVVKGWDQHFYEPQVERMPERVKS